MVGGVYPGCAASATSYAALNDLDAVAAATPPYGAPYTGTWTIPTTLPAGDYALLVEVNKEFDNNAAHTHPSYADPQLSGYGLANNFGQPSVVYRVPIHIDVGAGAAAAATTSQIAGYSDWTGASGAINARDATISTADPGSGEGRLLEISTAAGTGRVHVQVQPCGSTTACTPPPPAPGTVSEVAAAKDGLTDTSAVVTFKNARSDGGGAVAGYEIRYREGDSMTDQEFVEAIRAPQVAPGAPGSTATLTLSGLKPATDYVVGVRAVDTCGQTSLLAQVGFATPATPFKQVEGCFVATAAWGSALAVAGRGAAPGARQRAIGKRHGRGRGRPLLPFGAPGRRGPPPQRHRARGGPNVTFSGRRHGDAPFSSFLAIIRPLMSRGRSLLYRRRRGYGASGPRPRAPPTNAPSSSTSRPPSARRSRSGSRRPTGRS